MRIGYIKYNGKTNNEVGLRVEHHPHRIIPARKMEIVSVPGRSGDLIFEQNAYENYEQAYDVWIDPRRGYYETAQAIAQWLMAEPGYHRLEDEHDNETYRLAYFSGSADFDNRLSLIGKATLRFNCKPQRWIKFGEQPKQIKASGGSLFNPTTFAALPLIKVYGSGAGELSVGNVVCRLDEIDEHIMLDSDLHNAYKGLENKNNTVYIPEFPVLGAGETIVEWSGGITGVEITPRWWML